jgi:hypothetical protein
MENNATTTDSSTATSNGASTTVANTLPTGTSNGSERPMSPTESLIAKDRASKGTEQKTETQEPAVKSDPASNASSAEDKTKSEWNGNFADLTGLPEQLHGKAREMQRLMTEATTKAKALDEFKASQEYQAFQTWAQQQEESLAASQVEIAPGIRVPQELAERALVDPSALAELVQHSVKAAVGEATKESKREQTLAEKESAINSFAQANADFWTLYDDYGAIVKDQLASGKSLEEAYKHVKSLEEKAENKATQKLQQRVSEKKAAVTFTPSSGSTPDVVWVDTQADSRRVAMEFAEKGQKVDVRVRPRKRA